MNIIGPYIRLAMKEAWQQMRIDALDGGNWEAQRDLAHACDVVLCVLPPCDAEHGWGGFANVDQDIERAEIKRHVLADPNYPFNDLIILGNALNTVFIHLYTKGRSQ